MGNILILPKASAFTETEMPYLDNSYLPLRYMSDYSVLALAVDKFKAARILLEKKCFKLVDTPVGVEIVVDSVTRLKDILNLLNEHKIEATLTAMTTQIYQG